MSDDQDKATGIVPDFLLRLESKRRRREALQELIAESERVGLYDIEAKNDG